MQNESFIHVWPEGEKYRLWVCSEDQNFRESIIAAFPKAIKATKTRLKLSNYYVEGTLTKEELVVLCIKFPNTKMFPADD